MKSLMVRGACWTLAATLAGCANFDGTMEGPPETDESVGIRRDEWGGQLGSELARPATGAFGIVEDEATEWEPEPAEEEGPDEPESPAEEDPERVTEDLEGEPHEFSEGEDDSRTAFYDENGNPTPAYDDEGGGGSGGGAGGGEGRAMDVPEMTEGRVVQGVDEAEYRGRRAWFHTPSGSPIWLNGVNTAWSTANALGIARYMRGRTPADEWRSLSGSDGWALNWVGSWVAADNPMFAAPNARAPYGVVVRINPEPQLRDASTGQPVMLANGQPFPLRGHFLQDPTLPAPRQILCGGIGRHVFGDPFNPDYVAHARAQIQRQVAPHVDRANLVLWYVDNEQGIGDYTRERALRGSNPERPECVRGSGLLDLRRFVWTQCPSISSITAPFCAPHALGSFLLDRYGTIEQLNRAWGTQYASFDALLAARPHPDNGARGDDLADFALILVRQWVRLTTGAIREFDRSATRTRPRPISSPRLALANDRAFRFYSLGRRADRWTTGGEVPDHHARRAGVRVNRERYPVLDPNRVRFDPYRAFGRFASERDGGGFDVISVNVYTGAERFPSAWLRTGFGRLRAVSRAPVLISEFGLRIRDTCWTNSGGAASYVGGTEPYRFDDPRDAERGRRYASQVRQFIRLGAIGASWHRWVDDERPAPMNARAVASCGNRPRRVGQRKGLIQNDGDRYRGLFRGVHGLNVGLYRNIRSARTWWR